MSQTGRRRFVRYLGSVFTNTTPVVVTKTESVLPAVWAFAEAGEFESQIRSANQKVSIDNGYVTKVPFDLAHWQNVAAEKYPHGLPEPESDDRTQWLFHGYPGGAVEAASSRLTPDTRQDAASTLQVAIARLLGYRWPAELDAQMRLSDRTRELVQRCDELQPLADRDGIVCIPAVRGEAPAPDRLLNLLAKAYGPAWSTDTRNRLLKEAGYAGKTLETRPLEAARPAAHRLGTRPERWRAPEYPSVYRSWYFALQIQSQMGHRSR